MKRSVRTQQVLSFPLMSTDNETTGTVDGVATMTSRNEHLHDDRKTGEGGGCESSASFIPCSTTTSKSVSRKRRKVNCCCRSCHIQRFTYTCAMILLLIATGSHLISFSYVTTPVILSFISSSSASLSSSLPEYSASTEIQSSMQRTNIGSEYDKANNSSNVTKNLDPDEPLIHRQYFNNSNNDLINSKNDRTMDHITTAVRTTSSHNISSFVSQPPLRGVDYEKPSRQQQLQHQQQRRSNVSRTRGAKYSAQWSSRTRHVNNDDNKNRPNIYIDNVLLQGQFNYDMPGALIQFWVQTWSKYFRHILVVGPFSVETQEHLTKAKIRFRSNPDKNFDDKGFVSPYHNLMITLQDEYNKNDDKDSGKNVSSSTTTNNHAENKIDGVLYIHDDALVNLSAFFGMTKKMTPMNQTHPNAKIQQSPSSSSSAMIFDKIIGTFDPIEMFQTLATSQQLQYPMDYTIHVLDKNGRRWNCNDTYISPTTTNNSSAASDEWNDAVAATDDETSSTTNLGHVKNKIYQTMKKKGTKTNEGLNRTEEEDDDDDDGEEEEEEKEKYDVFFSHLQQQSGNQLPSSPSSSVLLFESFLDLREYYDFFKWIHWENCIQQQTAMILEYSEADEDYEDSVDSYKNHDDNDKNKGHARYDFPSPFQSDILYVPLKYTNEFVTIAQRHLKHQVFLECALPKIVYTIAGEYAATTATATATTATKTIPKAATAKSLKAVTTSSATKVSNTSTIAKTTTTNLTSINSGWSSRSRNSNGILRNVRICTMFGSKTRGTMTMLETCYEQQKQYQNQKNDDDNRNDDDSHFAVYHPFKLSTYGITVWKETLDSLQTFGWGKK